MSLTNEQKKLYRNIGHTLSPVVIIAGKGLSSNVMAEINRALSDHELIKVKVAIADRDARATMIKDLCKRSHALDVQQIGKVALIYRAAKKPNSKLSNLHKPLV